MSILISLVPKIPLVLRHKTKMGSSSAEEEYLAQMVCDFIESRSPSPISLTTTTSQKSACLSYHNPCLTLQEILSNNVTNVEMVLLEKVFKYLKNARYERRTSSLKKWLVARLRMDGFHASLCTSKNSWITNFNCPGGEYEYIEIVMKDDKGTTSSSMRLIVDVDFKSQFELARPTETYKNLLNKLPSIFVGCEDKLLNIVSLVCSAAKQSLKERGLHIPPWRKTNYMQSKWLSTHTQNCELVNSSKFTKWSPPKLQTERKNTRKESGSALSIQFSNISINCC